VPERIDVTIQAKLIAALALLIALIGSHWYVLNMGRRLERTDWLAAQIKADAAATSKYNAVAQQLESAKNERQIVTQTITKQVIKLVDRPVYLNSCLDDDGLLLAQAAITGKNPGQPASAVPTTGATGRKDGQGLAR
jgi:hypothetical protein